MKRVSRRQLLLGSAVVIVGAAGVSLLPPVRRSICGDPSADPDGTLRDLGVIAIGEACVACDPRLTRTEVAAQWSRLGAPQGASLQRLIETDFAEGRMTSVQGWMFAKAEVLAYAASYHGIA